jgi:hypothetical protein
MAHFMPFQDAGHPILERCDILEQPVALVGIELEIVTQGGQFEGYDALELPYSGSHQIIHHIKGALGTTIEELLNH